MFLNAFDEVSLVFSSFTGNVIVDHLVEVGFVKVMNVSVISS